MFGGNFPFNDPHAIQAALLAAVAASGQAGTATAPNNAAIAAAAEALVRPVVGAPVVARPSTSTPFFLGFRDFEEFDDVNLLEFVNENSATLSFPQKLMLMLTHVDRETARSGKRDWPISWTQDGRAFVISSRKEFADKILALFFRESKFPSFTRKLYRWGFRQICIPPKGSANRVMTFGHEYFCRDDKSLMSKMKSMTAAGKRRAEESAAQKGTETGNPKNDSPEVEGEDDDGEVSSLSSQHSNGDAPIGGATRADEELRRAPSSQHGVEHSTSTNRGIVKQTLHRRMGTQPPAPEVATLRSFLQQQPTVAGLPTLQTAFESLVRRQQVQHSIPVSVPENLSSFAPETALSLSGVPSLLHTSLQQEHEQSSHHHLLLSLLRGQGAAGFPQGVATAHSPTTSLSALLQSTARIQEQRQTQQQSNIDNSDLLRQLVGQNPLVSQLQPQLGPSSLNSLLGGHTSQHQHGPLLSTHAMAQAGSAPAILIPASSLVSSAPRQDLLLASRSGNPAGLVVNASQNPHLLYGLPTSSAPAASVPGTNAVLLQHLQMLPTPHVTNASGRAHLLPTLQDILAAQRSMNPPAYPPR